jgi:hypothetical protein
VSSPTLRSSQSGSSSPDSEAGTFLAAAYGLLTKMPSGAREVTGLFAADICKMDLLGR